MIDTKSIGEWLTAFCAAGLITTSVVGGVGHLSGREHYRQAQEYSSITCSPVNNKRHPAVPAIRSLREFTQGYYLERLEMHRRNQEECSEMINLAYYGTLGCGIAGAAGAGLCFQKDEREKRRYRRRGK